MFTCPPLWSRTGAGTNIPGTSLYPQPWAGMWSWFRETVLMAMTDRKREEPNGPPLLHIPPVHPACAPRLALHPVLPNDCTELVPHQLWCPPAELLSPMLPQWLASQPLPAPESCSGPKAQKVHQHSTVRAAEEGAGAMMPDPPDTVPSGGSSVT